MADAPGPQTEAAFYKEQKPTWSMLDSLLGGTTAMRKKGDTFLPKYPAEHNDNYKHRLERAVLLNYFKRTIVGLVGKPFSKPLVIPDNMLDDIDVLFDDVDRQGNDLDTFARQAFRIGITKGMVHIMVDFPQTDGSVRSLAEEKEVGAEPYMVAIDPDNVISAYSEYINGVEVLTHVRIKECVVEKDDWDEKIVERIRILEPGIWEVWTKDEKGNYEKTDNGTTSLSYIPMVTFYAERIGFMRSRPPLLDLAHLNVAHWQSASDQRNVLSVSRFPILGASGVDPTQKLEIGPNTYFAIQEPSGKLYYVEHGGAAIGAGRQDLEDLKSEMAMMGLQLLMPQSGNQTATAKAMDGAEANCGLQSLTLMFQNTLNEAIYIMRDWKDQGDADVDDVVINVDFGMTMGAAQDVQVLLAARAAREISHNTFITELKRRGIINDDFDQDDNAEELADETSASVLGLPEPKAGVESSEPAPKPTKDGEPVEEGDAPPDEPTADEPIVAAPKPAAAAPVPGAASVNTGTVKAAPGKTAAAPEEPQKKALAAGQIGSLLEIIQSVSDKKLDPEAAVDLILISFPDVDVAVVRKMIDAAKAFTPAKDPAPIINPGGPPQPPGLKVRRINIKPPGADGSTDATVEGD